MSFHVVMFPDLVVLVSDLVMFPKLPGKSSTFSLYIVMMTEEDDLK